METKADTRQSGKIAKICDDLKLFRINLADFPEIHSNQTRTGANEPEDDILRKIWPGFPVLLGSPVLIPAGLNQDCVSSCLRIVEGNTYFVPRRPDRLKHHSRQSGHWFKWDLFG